MTIKKYFSFSAEADFELHDTAEEAEKAANDALDYERNNTFFGCSYYASQICWGELKQMTVDKFGEVAPDDDDDDFDYDDREAISEYVLVDV
jgi:hypothetical protein